MSAILSGISARRISRTITFYANEWPAAPASLPGRQQPRPLLLLLPWLGSRPQALTKYCEVYLRTGFDILVVESEIRQFLWPRWGLEYGGEVLRLLQSDDFAHRPLLVHAFSIGGYTFTQILVHVSRDAQRYLDLTSRIKGHVYDSMVAGSLERMAMGLGKSLFPRWEGLVTRASLLYFSAFKRHTVDYFNAGLQVFQNNPVMAPALFFYCENDQLCDHLTIDRVIEHWRKRGMAVDGCKWEESIHAGHLRCHPQEYLSTLDAFLRSLNMVPLKSKM